MIRARLPENVLFAFLRLLGDRDYPWLPARLRDARVNGTRTFTWTFLTPNAVRQVLADLQRLVRSDPDARHDAKILKIVRQALRAALPEG